MHNSMMRFLQIAQVSTSRSQDQRLTRDRCFNSTRGPERDDRETREVEAETTEAEAEEEEDAEEEEEEEEESEDAAEEAV